MFIVCEITISVDRYELCALMLGLSEFKLMLMMESFQEGFAAKVKVCLPFSCCFLKTLSALPISIDSMN